jgi:hypothetical protein
VSNATADLTFAQGDAEWLRLRAKSLADLYWFCENVLDYGSRIPMTVPAHRLLCDFVAGTTGEPALDGARYRKLELPRDWGKTTLVTQGYVIQRVCADPDISVLIANEKEQNAKDFLAAIKWQFESNELLRALFPEVIPPDLNETTWSASRIVANRSSGRKEPTVFVIGVGGTVTGMHPDLIVVDDMISREAMENARAGSWQIMHQVNRWINQLDPLVNKNHPKHGVIFIGTRWWHGDSYEHVERAYGYGETPTLYSLRCKLPSGETQVMHAQRMGDLAIYRRQAIEHARSAFPEKWSLDDLAKIRVRDEALFACNYMNNPSDELTATFKAEWLRYYAWLDDSQVTFTDGAGTKKVARIRDLDVLFFVDPGGFGTRQVEDRARAAIVVIGSDGAGMHLVLDVYSEKDTFLACIQQIVSWVTRYQPRKLVIERAGQQGAFIQLVREHLAQAGLVASIEEVRPTRLQKEIRILGLEPYFQRGEILLGKGPNMHELRTQYRQFPRAARLDVLDALAYLPNQARKSPGGVRSSAQRRAEELAIYRQRRGLTHV